MYIRQTNSTNTLIRSCEDARPAQVEAAPEDTLYPSLLTLRAGYQTAGRGQQGNGWESEPQANLLFSTLIRPDALPADRQFILSVMVSVALWRMVATLPGIEADRLTIKWPNDLYYDDGKLAGMLIENTLSAGQVSSAVAGIGLNVNQTTFTAAPNPISLKMITGREYACQDLLLGFLEQLKEALEEAEESIWQTYREHLYRRQGWWWWQPREVDTTPNLPVWKADETDNSRFEAAIDEVTEDGRLGLVTRQGEKRHYHFKQIRYIHYLLLLLLTLVGFGCKDRNVPEEEQPVNDTTDTRTADQKRNPAYLYDITAVPEITITVTEEDWNTYLHNFDHNHHNSIYVPAKWTFRKGDEVWHRDSVGLRARGNTSRRRPEGSAGQDHVRNGAKWHHAHFGIKFTEYTTGERFFGSDRVVLKWFNNDPSYCREIFCYDLFRRFDVWSAPRASYCRLYIHIEGDDEPAYFGVYALIEGVRKGWRDDRKKDGYLPDNTGNLWKAAYNMCGQADLSDFNSTRTGKMGVADDEHLYSYALKTNKEKLSAAKTELYNFMEKMRPLTSGTEQLKTYLEENMDVDLFLRALAVNVAVGMWDDYWVNANNYYFYFDANHRFYFVPYDYDNTLGTTKPINGLQNAGTQNPLYWGSRNGDRLLIRKVLSISAYEQKYKDYLKQIITSPNLMEPEAAMQRVRDLQALVRDYVPNDTGEDNEIADRPSPEGSNIQYRLLSGDSQGRDNSNFFRTKAASITW